MTVSLERRYADRLEDFSERHPFLVDLVLAMTLMGCATLGSALTLPGAEPPDQDKVGVALMGVSCLVLLKHRAYPRTALAVTSVCTVIAIALGYLLTPLLLAPIMAALYWLATLTDRRTTRAYGITTIVVMTLAAVLSDSMDHLSLVLRTIGPAFWLLLPLAVGRATQIRRAYLKSVQARAEHAERTREEEAHLRVTEERMRIARDLHDVVAHHLALANAQAGTAAHLTRTDPEQAHRILTDLTSTTSAALRELKATVGVLRRPDDPEAPLTPAPGLDRLPDLTAACESAGLTVTVTTEGAPGHLDPGVDLTAYRIVQEALTNVSKHAGVDAARVRLAYEEAHLTITVTDDGSAGTPRPARAAEPGRGFGLIGMRERAQSVGGRLSAGHRPEGGFEVTTDLPLRTRPRTPEPDAEPTRDQRK
ncbi:sensor histidine kinase [Streptomyces europaeiscabiei]|uniref:histidine kinase n=1 Tax=Streptomyces europaeiscabiei TaxID=146819 RepID=A0ABU4NCJ8_9ACTN|nr:sensor histidine kinase [Streptomyces europaeiscabiei]MDX2524114.1 sensor histidine kinase [Streptomyces europaeiscabiei]MDX2763322.1 sensor histidine kinase [Streptomyces europaeiscabiei]MDX3545379.1 sensor histidine kinase [Streptomyces europaeiscabiei]MDX3554370.1 sensor histidine kinase [Streptomyces europaeiscabiei]MDX3666336.1 sensor histidine kinase [Streptomyces europaeiscabiei]